MNTGMSASRGMLTDHFSWEETVTTQHREIDNSLPQELEDNVRRAAGKLEKVRALIGVPLHINSWYRCLALNTAIGGSKNSDHMQGMAIDFIAPAFGTPLEIAKKIREDGNLIGFKQLIMEHTWVHVSFPIPGVPPKLEVLSLLNGGRYAQGLTDLEGNLLA